MKYIMRLSKQVQSNYPTKILLAITFGLTKHSDSFLTFWITNYRTNTI